MQAIDSQIKTRRDKKGLNPSVAIYVVAEQATSGGTTRNDL